MGVLGLWIHYDVLMFSCGFCWSALLWVLSYRLVIGGLVGNCVYTLDLSFWLHKEVSDDAVNWMYLFCMTISGFSCEARIGEPWQDLFIITNSFYLILVSTSNIFHPIRPYSRKFDLQNLYQTLCRNVCLSAELVLVWWDAITLAICHLMQDHIMNRFNRCIVYTFLT